LATALPVDLDAAQLAVKLAGSQTDLRIVNALPPEPYVADSPSCLPDPEGHARPLVGTAGRSRSWSDVSGKLAVLFAPPAAEAVETTAMRPYSTSAEVQA
jgi:hypothetical protein